MRRSLSRLTLAVLCMSALTSELAAQQVQLEQALPPDTLALLSLSDCNASWDRFKKSALYQIWLEPEVQEFVAPLVAKAKEQIDKAKAQAAQQPGPMPAAVGLLDVVPGQIAIALLPPQPMRQPPIPEVVVLVQAHEGMDKIQELLKIGIAMAQGQAGLMPAPAITHQGVQVNILTSPFTSVCYAIAGKSLIVTTSKETMAKVLDGLKQPASPNLATSPALAGLTKRLGKPRETTLLINVEGLFKAYERTIMTMAPPQAVMAIEALGIKDIKSIASASAFDGPGMKDVVCIRAPGERSGIVSLLEMPMGEKKLLKLVPEDALFCVATKVDVANVYNGIMSLIESLDAEAHTQAQANIKEVEQEFGFSLQNDLINSIGDEVALYYNFPTELALMFRVSNPDGVNKVFKVLMDQAGAASPPRFRRGGNTDSLTLKFNGHEVRYVPIKADDVVLWPAYGMTKDLCVLALNPQTVKSVLRRLKAGSGRSILASPKFKQSAAKVAKKHVSISYADLAGMVGPVYEVAAFVIQWASNERDLRDPQRKLGLDFGKLPSQQAITRHLFPAVETFTVDAEGFWSESYSPLGGRGGLSGVLSSGLGMVVPAIAQARGKARQAASMSNLKQITLAMYMYLADHDDAFMPKDQFPQALHDYLEAKRVYYHPSTKGGEAGFPGNIDYVYNPNLPAKMGEVKSPGQTPMLWEKRPFGKNGMRVVAFCDGHVERVNPGRFQQLMQQAKPQPAQ